MMLLDLFNPCLISEITFSVRSPWKKGRARDRETQGNRILKPEHLEQVVFIQCGFQSFGLHPALDAPLVL